VLPAFDQAVLAADPGPRGDVLAVLSGALAAIEPRAAVRRHLRRRRDGLALGSRRLPLPRGQVVILALGKAAPAMASAAVEVLAGIPLRGLVAAPGPPQPLPPLGWIPAGHPLPDAGSERAGRLLLDLAAGAGAEDLVLVLVSGGGSALAEVPAPGLTLEDLETANRALLRSGAPISQVNAVRKHLSALKGGWLARAAAPARLATLALSDVVGADPATIASGPTVPDPTTFADALSVVQSRRLRVPKPVLAALREGAAGRRPETPKQVSPSPFVVVADGAAAAGGAVAAARARGLTPRLASTVLEGEAEAVGRQLAATAAALAIGEMAVYAGETTVTVTGGGRGGRNQEVALAAGIALETVAGGPLVASFGTDGVDGPTDAAGGIGDPGTAVRGRRHGLDARSALSGHDSYPYLAACSDLLCCGPTGTNTGDIMLAYRPRRG
jgi:glycerate 2-kinase